MKITEKRIRSASSFKLNRCSYKLKLLAGHVTKHGYLVFKDRALCLVERFGDEVLGWVDPAKDVFQAIEMVRWQIQDGSFIRFNLSSALYEGEYIAVAEVMLPSGLDFTVEASTEAEALTKACCLAKLKLMEENNDHD